MEHKKMDVQFAISSEQMQGFRALSGDVNPLHFDAVFARARGFDGPVVFGGLIIAQVSRLLGNHLPGPGCVWQSLSFRFKKPLYVEQPARLTAEVTHEARGLGVCVLAITVTSGASVIATGEVMAQLATPDAREVERLAPPAGAAAAP